MNRKLRARNVMPSPTQLRHRVRRVRAVRARQRAERSDDPAPQGDDRRRRREQPARRAAPRQRSARARHPVRARLRDQRGRAGERRAGSARLRRGEVAREDDEEVYDTISTSRSAARSSPRRRTRSPTSWSRRSWRRRRSAEQLALDDVERRVAEREPARRGRRIAPRANSAASPAPIAATGRAAAAKRTHFASSSGSAPKKGWASAVARVRAELRLVDAHRPERDDRLVVEGHGDGGARRVVARVVERAEHPAESARARRAAQWIGRATTRRSRTRASVRNELARALRHVALVHARVERGAPRPRRGRRARRDRARARSSVGVSDTPRCAASAASTRGQLHVVAGRGGRAVDRDAQAREGPLRLREVGAAP